jgi:hypothetical protein
MTITINGKQSGENKKPPAGATKDLQGARAKKLVVIKGTNDKFI